MQIRLEGYAHEMGGAVELLKQSFPVVNVSKYYQNGKSSIGRVYVTLANDSYERWSNSHAG